MDIRTRSQDSTGTYRSPQWWTDQHTSGWERVKEAFRRDWEQTKADFSSTSGQELNQDAGDTIKQATGAAPLPPPGVKTPEDPKAAIKDVTDARVDAIKANADANVDAVKARAKAEVTQAKVDAKVQEVRQDQAEAERRAQEKIAKVQRDAAEELRKDQEKIGEANAKLDEAMARWRNAEQEARYGFAARSQYATHGEWNDQLESRLRSEWDSLGYGRSWSESREGVRRGWDYAGRIR